ncbi:mitochondrial import receptor subunit TOM7 homolog [Athene noctua]|uniref:mitochondrial import receptor subunit TOM7 homolog n=1 Tax=Athene noctua TaxID=126797 RepID=UPI003EB99147
MKKAHRFCHPLTLEQTPRFWRAGLGPSLPVCEADATAQNNPFRRGAGPGRASREPPLRACPLGGDKRTEPRGRHFLALLREGPPTLPHAARQAGWAPPPHPPPLSPAAGMPKLSKEAKQRLQQLFKGGQFAIRWGFIPVVLYLGFKRGADPGMPEPTIWSLLWG